LTCAAIAAAVAVVACKDEKATLAGADTVCDDAGGGGGGTSPAQSTIVLSDGDSMSIALSALKGMNARAQLAMTSATEATVKNFAQKLADDANKQGTALQDLASKNGITPPGNPMANALDDSSTNLTNLLGGFQGGELDRRFVDGEMLASAQLIGLIDATLAPGANNPDYRTWLSGLRDMLVTDLTNTQSLEREVDASIGQPTDNGGGGDNGGGTNGGGGGDDGGGTNDTPVDAGGP
jgi:predicted outer membrane protein